MTIPEEIVNKALVAANDAASYDDTDHTGIMRAALTAVLLDLTAAVAAERDACKTIAWNIRTKEWAQAQMPENGGA